MGKGKPVYPSQAVWQVPHYEYAEMLFEIGSDPALFGELKIMQEKDLCEKYMGKFPVISISLKNVDGLSFESASVALRTLIGSEASRFNFLKNSANLSDNDKEAYAQLTEVGPAQGGFYTMTEAWRQ